MPYLLTHHCPLTGPPGASVPCKRSAGLRTGAALMSKQQGTRAQDTKIRNGFSISAHWQSPPSSLSIYSPFPPSPPSPFFCPPPSFLPSFLSQIFHPSLLPPFLPLAQSNNRGMKRHDPPCRRTSLVTNRRAPSFARNSPSA